MERIKSWFRSLGSKMESWMYGRYGYDELSHCLSMVALACLIAGLFVWPGVLSSIALVLYVIVMVRTYSKNITKRQRERDGYLRMTAPVRNWSSLQKRKFSERKTHRYFKCSQCKTSLRVPKGKGKIKIHCPKCGAEIIKTT